MQNKFAEVSPRNFSPTWAPGRLSDEARKAVNAAFDAMIHLAHRDREKQ